MSGPSKTPLQQAVSRLHFVGVGGAGMSALATVALGQGFEVSGSDHQRSDTTQRLTELGLRIGIGHDAHHLGAAQVLVASTAVPQHNPELMAARAKGLPVVPRAAMLAELMHGKSGLAVAGTHGKTTTTALLASVLMAAGADPSFVVGGRLRVAASGNTVGTGGHCGQGPHFVAEADESDASFLHLNPLVAIVTNIDADHMETYGHSTDKLHAAFVDFIHRLPFYGCAVLCADDPGVLAVLPQVQRPVLTYGLGPAAQLQALHVQALAGARMQFVARQAGHADLPVVLNLAGLHNVNNALATLAVARWFKVPDGATAAALRTFAGVGRRFEQHGQRASADGGQYTLIDDYGHHPTEVAAVLAAARGAFAGQRLLLAFQPHRYSRTRDCMDDFVRVLAQADALVLTEVYAAGEAPIGGADAASLMAQLLHQRPGLEVHLVPDVNALPQALQAATRHGDVVITMGAGSIGAVAAQMSTGVRAAA
jgi:UDP-N-acetylmuramate--alanine ligase